MVISSFLLHHYSLFSMGLINIHCPSQNVTEWDLARYNISTYPVEMNSALIGS